VLTLDMGDPVRVVDLVEAMIRLSGFEPDVDVPIQFVGARPGEKLREELVLAEEGVVATSEEKIFVARLGREPDPAALELDVAALADAAAVGDPARIRALLQETVPTYHPAPGSGSDETLAELLEGSQGEESDS
jgi:FlaA1/EpsC-like NDP-sugar epimerase